MTVDQLTAYGLEQMDDEAIRSFLDQQSSGVLGLPSEGVPYMIPLSYAFDGADSLYFTYLLGASSRKEELTETAGRAGFLIYDVETMFKWQSVLLTGDLRRVPEAEWDDLDALPNNAWRPNLLQTASTSGGVAVYEFAITERNGIRQDGLAPEFRENISP